MGIALAQQMEAGEGIAPDSGAIQPFMLSVTTLTPNAQKWNLGYFSGYGEKVNGPFGYDGVSQELSIKGYLGNKFTLYANAGFGIPDGDGRKVTTSQQAEILRDFIGGNKEHGFRLGAGLGAAHDYVDATSIYSRITATYDTSFWRFGGNLVLAKVLQSNRDALDITTSLGIQYQLFENLYAGLEAMGQDLEGFWEEDEAEGGARLLFGPSVNYCPPQSKWMLTLSGGPMIYATHSTVVPMENGKAVALENGFSIRALITFDLAGSSIN